jgi:predicted PurR-regulated permease PerM
VLTAAITVVRPLVTPLVIALVIAVVTRSSPPATAVTADSR